MRIRVHDSFPFGHSRTMAILQRVGLALALALTAAAPQAFADEPAPEAARPHKLVVRVNAPPNTVSPQAVRAAVARELGVEVHETGAANDSALEVRVIATPRSARVEYVSREGKRVIRTIDLPQDPDRAAETIGLLAGNLVRDEASELLRSLQKPAPAPAAASAPAPASASAPAPAAASASAPAPAPAPAAAPASAPAPAPAPRELPFAPVDLALFHPLSWPAGAESHRVAIELGLVYGRVGALEGGGIVGIVSRVDGDTSGAQIAGAVSLTGGSVRGFSGAGLVTLVNGNAHGVVGSGAFSAVHGRTEGVIGAPVALTGKLYGAQLSVVGIADGGDGAQLGVVNLSGDFRGGQLGLVNLGKNVKGVQLGLVNVAEHADAPIGLVSVTRDTRVHATAFSSLQFPANAGIKLVTGWVFSEIFGGFAFDREVGDSKRKDEVARYGAALGAHIPLAPVFFEPSVAVSQELPLSSSTPDERLVVAGYRAVIGLQPVRAFGLFLGGELRQEIPEDTGSSRLGADVLAGVQLF